MKDNTLMSRNVCERTGQMRVQDAWCVRYVPEDDDDFFLSEIYVDDYAYRRQHARRPDHPELAYIDSPE